MIEVIYNIFVLYMNDLAYSVHVYEPESVFSSWLSLSYILLTTGLLFYHMSNLKTIKASPRVSATIAISLVLISTMYMIYSVGPYTLRMNNVIHMCENDDKCSKQQVKHLRIIKNSYVGLGVITSIVQLIIIYLIGSELYKKL
jgi:hypothetical protein